MNTKKLGLAALAALIVVGASIATQAEAEEQTTFCVWHQHDGYQDVACYHCDSTGCYLKDWKILDDY